MGIHLMLFPVLARNTRYALLRLFLSFTGDAAAPH